MLGLARDASDDDIKRAYRKYAIQYHPDRNPGDKVAEDSFKEVNEAYQVLSNPAKRSAYDQFGHAGLGGQGFGGFEQGFGGGSFTDIFDNIFGDIFGGGRGQASAGTDLKYNLEITFEEAAYGVEKTIKFEKEVACGTCRGSGARAGSQPTTCSYCRGSGQMQMNQGFFTLSRTCPHCRGRGSIVKEKCGDCRGAGRQRKNHSVVVTLPAGIDTDQRLRVRGEGEISEAGGQPGDLYVVVRVKEHPLFQREAEHLVLELPVSFVTAALGDELEIPSLEGRISFKVPPGTQSGKVFKLKGKGIKRINGVGYGDMFVKLFVETPTKLNAKQKQALKDFKKIETEEAHPTISSFLQKFKELFK